MGHHRNNNTPPKQANIDTVVGRLAGLYSGSGCITIGDVAAEVDKAFGKKHGTGIFPLVVFALQEEGFALVA